jgi:large subunit ribosomal protein L30
MAENKSKRVRITFAKSAIGYKENQKRTIAALGLKKLGQAVEVVATPQIRGMIHTVRHLVKVEELD